MKRILCILGLLLTVPVSQAQIEFDIHQNGLMYDNTIMNQLEHIVDSLNLKFKTCDPYKTYYSKYQAKGHLIRMKRGFMSQAKRDNKNNMPFDEFIKKHPNAKVEKNRLVVRHQYDDYSEYDIVSMDGSYGMDFREPVRRASYNEKMKGKWVFDYDEKSEYNKESLRAFFFSEELERTPLAIPHARLVQYADCMIDTSQTIISRRSGKNELSLRFRR